MLIRLRVRSFLLLASALAVTGSGCAKHGGRQGLPPPERVVLSAPVSVPMGFVGGRPTVAVRINGRGPYEVILDTGAAGSVFSESLAIEWGLPRVGHATMTRPGGTEQAPAVLTRVETIELGGLRLEGVAAVYTDMSQMQHHLGSPIAGVLSATMLDGLLVTYNYPAKRIEIRAGGLPAADGRMVFDWPANERLLSVPMEIDGHATIIDIDTGSNGGFTLPQTTTRGLAWLEGPVAAESIRTMDHSTPSAVGRLRGDIRIGQFTFSNPSIRTNDGVLATIGYDVLKDFVLTVDAKSRRFELRK